MPNFKWLHNTVIRGHWPLVWALSLPLILGSVALAGYVPDSSKPTGPSGGNTTRAYEPPDSSSPHRAGGNTTRGSCDASSGNTLTILAPLGHNGRTTSTHPTFAWFVPDSKPYPIEFSLYEYGSKGRGKRVMKLNKQSTPGVMKLTLPLEEPGLEVGQEYLWQVAVLCDRNRPSKDQIANAIVHVVAPSPSLKADLATAKTPVKRAELYAKAGIWYDALRETLDEPTAKAFRLTLLNDLIQLEAANQSDEIRQQTKQLKEVVESEQRK